MSLHLLIIDPQNDFCDLPETHTRGLFAPSLPVSGAHADMQRLARFIDQHGAQISEISVSLDSHQRLDVAHPPFWRDAQGEMPAPFTEITAADVRQGRYLPTRAEHRERALRYLDALEARGRYKLMIWPVHCEIGSLGHAVHADLQQALARWQSSQQKNVHYLHKGENPWTEHYSALCAEVPDEHDARTNFRHELLEQLTRAERVLVAGEASSHCVRATVLDLLEPNSLARPAGGLDSTLARPAGGLDSTLARPAGGLDPTSLQLLCDCMSPVRGFEDAEQAFFAELRARGVRLIRSSEWPVQPPTGQGA